MLTHTATTAIAADHQHALRAGAERSRLLRAISAQRPRVSRLSRTRRAGQPTPRVAVAS